jgi:hypothetical protein
MKDWFMLNFISAENGCTLKQLAAPDFFDAGNEMIRRWLS